MTHEDYMRECLRLAKKGAWRVSPNPMVGALLVRRGRIIARGYHRSFGGPHAEVECLARAKGDLSSATLYVNLEPCSHHGKTPPCVDAIREWGVGNVVVAMRDPNPLVSGKGVRSLRRAGVRVTEGILRSEAEHVNRIFTRHITRKRPYVHLKVARSLDGYISPANRRRFWLTSRASQTLVHRWRSENDVLLVGAGTVIADDPELNVRHFPGRDPVVAVLDGRLRIPLRSRLLQTGSLVIVFTTVSTFDRTRRKIAKLTERGAVIIGLPSKRGRISLRAVLRTLYRMDFGSILVEGGGQVFTEFVSEGLVDRLSVFTAPVTIGSGLKAFGTSRQAVPGHRLVVEAGGISVRSVGADKLLQVDFC